MRSNVAKPCAFEGELQRFGEDLYHQEVDVIPVWPFRLCGGSPDGLFRRRGRVLLRLVHFEEKPVTCAVTQLASDRVRFIARGPDRTATEWAIARMRFATGVDDDLRPFYDRFRNDPLIGKAVRRNPYLRVRRRPTPWEALAWGITEQLIEYEEAVSIQRRMIAKFGRRSPEFGLRDCPEPERLLTCATAELQALGLSELRSLTVRKVAREVLSRRIDLTSLDIEDTWRSLLAIQGLGPWTVEMLALFGQGRYDQVPATDLGYLKLVGRLMTGNPRARAREEEVRKFFSPYREWRGLAGEYLRWLAGRGLLPKGPIPARS